MDDIAVSPDGRHVYTSANIENAIGVFDRDPSTGRLAQSGVVGDGINGVSGLARAHGLVVSPDGGQIYAVASGPTTP